MNGDRRKMDGLFRRDGKPRSVPATSNACKTSFFKLDKRSSRQRRKSRLLSWKERYNPSKTRETAWPILQNGFPKTSPAIFLWTPPASTATEFFAFPAAAAGTGVVALENDATLKKELHHPRGFVAGEQRVPLPSVLADRQSSLKGTGASRTRIQRVVVGGASLAFRNLPPAFPRPFREPADLRGSGTSQTAFGVCGGSGRFLRIQLRAIFAEMRVVSFAGEFFVSPPAPAAPAIMAM